MLEIKLIRENPALVRQNLKKRNEPEKLKWFDDLIKKDLKWRKLKKEVDELRHKRNIISREINKLKKQGKNIKRQLALAKKIPIKIKEKETRIEKLEEKIRFYLLRLPNILDESVPIGKDETDNVSLRKWGKPKKINFKLKTHGELAEELNQADFKRAAKTSGAGFVFVKNQLALLDLALQRFAIDFLMKKGYALIQPPLMIRRKPYECVTDLDDFEAVMYKVEGEDLYLIATSEHSIAAMYMGEILDKLPLKFVGVSPCFRREIGSHGVDTRGFFRMHQFNKVEQFIFCKPDDSDKFFNEIVDNAEQLLRLLEIPYQVTAVCTGDIGTVASKKYDLDAWMPREQKYREVVSCANCKSYQATRLGIRYWDGNETRFVHTLNATALATSRTLRAILENYQKSNGAVEIPKVLRPYMNGLKEISSKK